MWKDSGQNEKIETYVKGDERMCIWVNVSVPGFWSVKEIVVKV